MASTKSVDARVARHVRAFLDAFLTRYFYDGNKGHKWNATVAAHQIGCSQSYLSDLANADKGKKPGLAFILLLAQQTGASLEEITGYRPPVRPPRPFSLLEPNDDLARAAAAEATSRHEERDSSTRTTSDQRAPRKK